VHRKEKIMKKEEIILKSETKFQVGRVMRLASLFREVINDQTRMVAQQKAIWPLQKAICLLPLQAIHSILQEENLIQVEWLFYEKQEDTIFLPPWVGEWDARKKFRVFLEVEGEGDEKVSLSFFCDGKKLGVLNSKYSFHYTVRNNAEPRGWAVEGSPEAQELLHFLINQLWFDEEIDGARILEVPFSKIRFEHGWMKMDFRETVFWASPTWDPNAPKKLALMVLKALQGETSSGSFDGEGREFWLELTPFGSDVRLRALHSADIPFAMSGGPDSHFRRSANPDFQSVEMEEIPWAINRMVPVKDLRTSFLAEFHHGCLTATNGSKNWEERSSWEKMAEAWNMEQDPNEWVYSPDETRALIEEIEAL
jgi:hypothetical protein